MLLCFTRVIVKYVETDLNILLVLIIIGVGRFYIRLSTINIVIITMLYIMLKTRLIIVFPLTVCLPNNTGSFTEKKIDKSRRDQDKINIVSILRAALRNSTNNLYLFLIFIEVQKNILKKIFHFRNNINIKFPNLMY